MRVSYANKRPYIVHLAVLCVDALEDCVVLVHHGPDGVQQVEVVRVAHLRGDQLENDEE